MPDPVPTTQPEFTADTPPLSPEKRRARFALRRVRSVTEKHEKYQTLLRKLPARLHANGLGQTAAFLLAKGAGEPEGTVYEWLAAGLQEAEIYSDDQLIQNLVGAGTVLNNDVVQAGVEANYRRASTEARALATWLKRFAEAFLAEEAATDAGTTDEKPEATPKDPSAAEATQAPETEDASS